MTKEISNNKILFVSFELEPQSCKVGDLLVSINGNANKLTCKEWKYYNGNTTFNYVISGDTSNKVEVTFLKGIYKIDNLISITDTLNRILYILHTI